MSLNWIRIVNRFKDKPQRDQDLKNVIDSEDTGLPMVLILECYSEHGAHTWKKIRFWLLSIKTNALDRSDNRRSLTHAHLFSRVFLNLILVEIERIRSDPSEKIGSGSDKNRIRAQPDKNTDFLFVFLQNFIVRIKRKNYKYLGCFLSLFNPLWPVYR